MNLASPFHSLVLLGIAQANYQAARLHAFHNIPLVVWDEANQSTQYINAQEWLCEHNSIPNH